MSPIIRIRPLFVLTAILAILAVGCGDSNSNFDPDTGKHVTGWSSADSHGTAAKAANGFSSCQDCHGADFAGGISLTSCFTCHGVNAPHPAAPWRAARTHATTDESNAPVCALCHTGGANSSVQPPVPAPAGTSPGCFNATLCHAQPGHAAGWNDPAAHGAAAKSAPTATQGFSSCQTCHGTGLAGSGSAVTCLDNSACHTGTSGFPYGPAPHAAAPWRTSAGSARTHTDTNEGNADVCFQCHVDGMYSGNTHSSSERLPGSSPSCYNNWLCHATPNPHLADPTWANAADHGAAAKSAPTATRGFSYCQTCHGDNFAGGSTTTSCLNNCHLNDLNNPVNAPHGSPWTSASTYKHSDTNEGNALDCGLCHLDEYTNGVGSRVYTPLPANTNINGCFDGRLCHTAASIGCVNCHDAAIDAPTASVVSAGSVTQRRAIVPEFTLTWSHKRSAGGTVVDGDCIVCHMEGLKATVQRDPAYHGDGYVDLRDPDTGTAVQGATFNGGTPGGYTSGGPGRFVQFSRDLSSSTLEANVTAIQINHCLKCHDANGASHADAQVAGGSALQPFGVAITGHTAPYDSNGNGNVVNVAASFATTNASYHPVSGKQNNSYVQGSRTIAPWNMVKTTGTTTSWGLLMSCWDCHAPAGASGTQNRTVTAHGGAVTLRAPVYTGGNTATANLCVNCHATSYSTTAGNHGAGSAFATGGSAGNMTATVMQRCHNCHAYTAAVGGNIPTTTFASRPLRAENVHGFNDRTPGSTNSTWTTSGVRPYAFIRNTLSVWAPALVSGAAPPAAHTCTGTGGTCGTDMNGENYTPGGTY